jgi:hypothetical protein
MAEAETMEVCPSHSLSINLTFQDHADVLRSHHHRPTIYMIRHGEKPRKDRHGDDPGGLSRKGRQRADALTDFFGKDSDHDIGLILAQRPRRNGARSRPYDTVKPLARVLGLRVDVSIGREDLREAADVATSFRGPGNVLICWEHHRLAKIAKKMGVRRYSRRTGKKGDRIDYDTDRFDLVWVIPYPYRKITDILSECVPGLDIELAEQKQCATDPSQESSSSEEEGDIVSSSSEEE